MTFSLRIVAKKKSKIKSKNKDQPIGQSRFLNIFKLFVNNKGSKNDNTIIAFTKNNAAEASVGALPSSSIFSAFFERNKPKASDTLSDNARDSILIVINAGFVVVWAIPAKRPVVVMTPLFRPKNTPWRMDSGILWRAFERASLFRFFKFKFFKWLVI